MEREREEGRGGERKREGEIKREGESEREREKGRERKRDIESYANIIDRDDEIPFLSSSASLAIQRNTALTV